MCHLSGEHDPANVSEVVALAKGRGSGVPMVSALLRMSNSPIHPRQAPSSFSIGVLGHAYSASTPVSTYSNLSHSRANVSMYRSSSS